MRKKITCRVRGRPGKFWSDVSALRGRPGVDVGSVLLPPEAAWVVILRAFYGPSGHTNHIKSASGRSWEPTGGNTKTLDADKRPQEEFPSTFSGYSSPKGKKRWMGRQGLVKAFLAECSRQQDTLERSRARLHAPLRRGRRILIALRHPAAPQGFRDRGL